MTLEQWELDNVWAITFIFYNFMAFIYLFLYVFSSMSIESNFFFLFNRHETYCAIEIFVDLEGKGEGEVGGEVSYGDFVVFEEFTLPKLRDLYTVKIMSFTDKLITFIH